jgi:hypothetical protein
MKHIDWKIPPILPLPKGGIIPSLAKRPAYRQAGVRGDFEVCRLTYELLASIIDVLR